MLDVRRVADSKAFTDNDMIVSLYLALGHALRVRARMTNVKYNTRTYLTVIAIFLSKFKLIITVRYPLKLKESSRPRLT